MSKFLHADHPDATAKPGDQRLYQGRTYKFGENQFSKYWLAGPKDGRVTCSSDYPESSANPYLGDGAACSTFEKAADRAKTGAKREYEKAKALVERYEGKD